VSSNALSEHLLDCLKRVAAALRDAELPYALGGGLSAWARGGPPSENDVDILIREEDRERAHTALAALGLRTEIPPEGWLVKAFDDEILIDLIYRPSGLVIDDDFLERCDELSVQAVWMRVMPLDDLLVSKLLSLTEHHLDFGRALEISRALREQIDWSNVRRRTEHSPFARAFLNLVVDLGIASRAEASAVDGRAPSEKAMVT
jgi:Uncharacterised nucleotidyltransferase